MPKVFLIYRKRSRRFFSIESVFDTVRKGWSDKELPNVVLLPRYGVSLLNLLFLFKLRLANRKAIFHITGDVHYGVLALPRSRTVLTIHDCVFLEQHRGAKRWFLKKILLDIPVSYVKHVTTISHKTKAEIVCNTGCDPEKIKVISNPVSPVFYYCEKAFDSAKPVLLFIGVTPNKNLERVCLAIKDIPCVLRIIGKLTRKQKEMVEGLNIKYESLYNITVNDMASQYVAADIILFPSLYEGFGLPILEGFKAGRIVLTSYISPMKEIAMDAAFLVDPFNTESIRQGILTILTHGQLREEKIKRGFDVVENYSAENVAKRYSQVYHEVFQNSGKYGD